MSDWDAARLVLEKDDGAASHPLHRWPDETETVELFQRLQPVVGDDFEWSVKPPRP